MSSRDFTEVPELQGQPKPSPVLPGVECTTCQLTGLNASCPQRPSCTCSHLKTSRGCQSLVEKAIATRSEHVLCARHMPSPQVHEVHARGDCCHFKGRETGALGPSVGPYS